jgi:1-acyl-sn-glycerol-3-phosphate acyltransferase
MGTRNLSDALAAPARLARRMGAMGRAWWRVRNEEIDGLTAASQALHRMAAGLSADNGLVIERRGPLPPPGCLVVSNHVSYVDTLVVPSLLPCTCIAKREVADWPVIGSMAVRLGVLFVDRDSPYSGAVVLRRARRALEAGIAVVAFPEGTTTSGDGVLPFRRGVFELARQLGTPVVAAALRYTDRDVAWTGDTRFVDHYVRSLARRRRTVVQLSLSAPFDPGASASGAALAREVRAYICDQLARGHRAAVAEIRPASPPAVCTAPIR